MFQSLFFTSGIVLALRCATFEILLLQQKCDSSRRIMILLSFLIHQKRRYDGRKNSGNHLFNLDKTTSTTQIWYHLWDFNPGHIGGN